VDGLSRDSAIPKATPLSQYTVDLSISIARKGIDNTPSNLPSYLVHIESMDSNIGNLHPMRLGKILANRFPAIINIKRLRRNLIVVNFKFSFDTKQFIQYSDTLPDNWFTYISGYKIRRVGVVRGVDVSLSVEEIY